MEQENRVTIRLWSIKEAITALLAERMKKQAIEHGYEKEVVNRKLDLNQVHMQAVKFDWKTDSIEVYLSHKEFPNTLPGHDSIVYWPEQLYTFPFLFKKIETKTLKRAKRKITMEE